jgi:dihydroxyacetone kinase-like protein
LNNGIDCAQIIEWLRNAATMIDNHREELTTLDAAIGDADHGVNLARGFDQVRVRSSTWPTDNIGAILHAAGMTLMSTVGGASGMLYGNFFLRAAEAAGDKSALTPGEVVQMLATGRDGIVQRGRAAPGDKTMLDVWTPAVAAAQRALAAGDDLPAIVAAAVNAAESGVRDTTPLQARRGRASYLGERSIGHIDPGAASSHLILQALAQSIQDLD